MEALLAIICTFVLVQAADELPAAPDGGGVIPGNGNDPLDPAAGGVSCGDLTIINDQGCTGDTLPTEMPTTPNLPFPTRQDCLDWCAQQPLAVGQIGCCQWQEDGCNFILGGQLEKKTYSSSSTCGRTRPATYRPTPNEPPTIAPTIAPTSCLDVGPQGDPAPIMEITKREFSGEWSNKLGDAIPKVTLGQWYAAVTWTLKFKVKYATGVRCTYCDGEAAEEEALLFYDIKKKIKKEFRGWWGVFSFLARYAPVINMAAAAVDLYNVYKKVERELKNMPQNMDTATLGLDCLGLMPPRGRRLGISNSAIYIPSNASSAEPNYELQQLYIDSPGEDALDARTACMPDELVMNALDEDRCFCGSGNWFYNASDPTTGPFEDPPNTCNEMIEIALSILDGTIDLERNFNFSIANQTTEEFRGWYNQRSRAMLCMPMVCSRPSGQGFQVVLNVSTPYDQLSDHLARVIKEQFRTSFPNAEILNIGPSIAGTSPDVTSPAQIEVFVPGTNIAMESIPTSGHAFSSECIVLGATMSTISLADGEGSPDPLSTLVLPDEPPSTGMCTITMCGCTCTARFECSDFSIPASQSICDLGATAGVTTECSNIAEYGGIESSLSSALSPLLSAEENEALFRTIAGMGMTPEEYSAIEATCTGTFTGIAAAEPVISVATASGPAVALGALALAAVFMQ